ncbi:hypothetical protein C8F04DRAFT_1201368 [Mycena alexandri]|uniref:Uncharacterized protein n=1 Tax=Mycena alexandri TaxID=1745969 RepID=A0AAD6WQ78_9AGAR|nr:hypothetical protein C8F04DRAFT_1201368 [Mycena alexandri]
MAGKLQLQKEIDSIRIFACVYSTKLRGDDLAFGGGDWYGDLHAPAASVVRTPVGPNWPPGTLLQDEGVTKLELELLLSVHKCAMAMDAVTNAGLDSDDDISCWGPAAARFCGNRLGPEQLRNIISGPGDIEVLVRLVYKHKEMVAVVKFIAQAVVVLNALRLKPRYFSDSSKLLRVKTKSDIVLLDQISGASMEGRETQSLEKPQSQYWLLSGSPVPRETPSRWHGQLLSELDIF